ncbi:hypothetical protein EVAR_26782_1 [Eumeta japonica]|uniref:Uncharacterized protein n=1 Tax=Eumeta variegata TaxID=151549 RepID=A0A4C1XCF3_EUMVA|nr:hypothetical protein EVAR_26782_1 [Eumeta japonica]
MRISMADGPMARRSTRKFNGYSPAAVAIALPTALRPKNSFAAKTMRACGCFCADGVRYSRPSPGSRRPDRAPLTSKRRTLPQEHITFLENVQHILDFSRVTGAVWSVPQLEPKREPTVAR